MTSLPKIMAKSGPLQNQTIIYHLKSIDKSYPKRYFLLNVSDCVKSYGHFCPLLALFMMPTHQKWSCHVTQDANFIFFLFCPNFTFNIRKSHKISSGKLSTLEVISQKPHGGGGGRWKHRQCL